MHFDRRRYLERVKEREAKSPLVKNCLFAFLFGGGICTLGQLLLSLYLYTGLSERDAGTLVAVSLIFLSAVLTGRVDFSTTILSLAATSAIRRTALSMYVKSDAFPAPSP